MTDSRRWRPSHSTKRCLLPTVQSKSRNIWINFSDNFILIQCLVELQRFWIIDRRITDHLCLIKLWLQMVRSQVVYHLELPGPFVVFACRKPFFMCLGLFKGSPVFLELTCDIFMLISRVFLINMAIFVFQMVVQITHSSSFWLLCSLLLVVFRNFLYDLLVIGQIWRNHPSLQLLQRICLLFVTLSSLKYSIKPKSTRQSFKLVGLLILPLT